MSRCEHRLVCGAINNYQYSEWEPTRGLDCVHARRMMRVQTAVVGGGVVGLAVARALAATRREVLILESEQSIGSGSSSRNSEVIHAGIYYPAGSLKAHACVDGRRLLYEYCDSRGVEYRRCGKLLVATDVDELPALQGIAEKAGVNGLRGPDEALVLLNPSEAAELEPHVRCVGALHSPSTGIIDSHGLMLSLLGDAQRDGADLALGTSVLGGQVLPNGQLVLQTSDGELCVDEVVNAAGHAAIPIAAALDGMPRHLVPSRHFAKGNYFGLSGMPSPFRGLVYPIPTQAGLGVHATVDLAGRCRFGPDVEWTHAHDDYEVDAARAECFYSEVRKYWPELPDGALVADYAGVRPKIQGPGEPAEDFKLIGPRAHGVRGLVHLFGIESPGLTASLALGRLCVEALDLD